MKKILLLCAVLLVGGAGVLLYALLRTPHFGAPFTAAPSVSIHELLEHRDRYLAADVRIEGKIVNQCPASGCWFNLKCVGDHDEIRVDLGHLGLVFPQKTGHTAVVEGRLTRVDDELTFIGTGVEFP